jgi:hypothetical protein
MHIIATKRQSLVRFGSVAYKAAASRRVTYHNITKCIGYVPDTKRFDVDIFISSRGGSNSENLMNRGSIHIRKSGNMAYGT